MRGGEVDRREGEGGGRGEAKRERGTILQRGLGKG